MTFKEAKAAADRIGGVVDWWWVYAVYPAATWVSFNGTHGYGVYHSKGAKDYIKARWKEEKARRKQELKEIIESWRQKQQIPFQEPAPSAAVPT